MSTKIKFFVKFYSEVDLRPVTVFIRYIKREFQDLRMVIM